MSVDIFTFECDCCHMEHVLEAEVTSLYCDECWESSCQDWRDQENLISKLQEENDRLKADLARKEVRQQC